MDLHNNRRIGDCHPILLLLSDLMFNHIHFAKFMRKFLNDGFKRYRVILPRQVPTC